MKPFSKDKDIAELVKISNELSHLASSAEVLSWDQQTFMPPKGGELRAMQLSTLSGIYHEKLTDPKVGKLLKKAKKLAKNIYDKALVREMEREYTKAIKLPKALVKEITEWQSRANESWRKAKQKSDFSLFQKDLEKLLGLKVRAAKLLQKKGQTLYDVFLDDFEPGMTEEEVQKIFEKLKPKLATLAAKLTLTTQNAQKVIEGKTFNSEKQWQFGLQVIEKMGFDFSAGRQDTSPHPVTYSFGSGDVRITTWKNENDLRSPLFSTVHEAGHALHHQGTNPALNHSHLCGSPSYGVSESQSRFWENILARSLPFWQHHYPLLQEHFGEQLKGVGLNDFVKAVNTVKFSPVRVEADEVTYGLHIILRFDIERELVGGKIKVKDLPKAWNERLKSMLGITPEDDREGVLQDIHWSNGLFGYFPTYLLGNLIAAQLWFTIKKEMPNVEKDIAAGKLLPTRQWLKEKIHQHGRLYTAPELVKRVTGEPLNPKYFLDYLEEKFNRLYPPKQDRGHRSVND